MSEVKSQFRQCSVWGGEKRWWQARVSVGISTEKECMNKIDRDGHDMGAGQAGREYAIYRRVDTRTKKKWGTWGESKEDKI